MKKISIIILLMIITIGFGFFYLLTTMDFDGLTFPHDELFFRLKSLSCTIPIIILIACTIIVSFFKESKKLNHIILVIVLIATILIPVILQYAAYSIHNYDTSHYKGEITNQFNPIEDK